MKIITSPRVVIAGVVSFLALILSLSLWQASSASASTVKHTAAYRTCKAFAAWEKRPTPGRLNTMMRDSVSAPWHPLGIDTVVLFTDARNGDAFDLPADKAAVTDDCKQVKL